MVVSDVFTRHVVAHASHCVNEVYMSAHKLH
jgi:hypothetical protein